ncbi:MAG: dephospho-CoA kinase [Treponema sp.]|nr:dephospho-CoA kinase [Treponema sp.]
MAAGKNVASAILAERGFATIDADVLVHDAIENAKDQIVAEFGAIACERNLSIVRTDGTVDRRVLGQIIFGDSVLVHKQEAIVFPYVNRLFDLFVVKNSGKNIAINATVLYKVPIMQSMDSILFVDAPWPMRYLRARKRDGLLPSQIFARFKSQANLFAKYKNTGADISRVWNIGTRACLEKKIDQFLSRHR